MYPLNKATTIGEINLSTDKLPIKELDHYKEHHRLRLFHRKGTTCVKCGKVGTHIKINELNKDKSIHVDVYTDNDELINVDHIVPKSKGGSKKNLSNQQVMCYDCNYEKGSNIE